MSQGGRHHLEGRLGVKVSRKEAVTPVQVTQDGPGQEVLNAGHLTLQPGEHQLQLGALGPPGVPGQVLEEVTTEGTNVLDPPGHH